MVTRPIFGSTKGLHKNGRAIVNLGFDKFSVYAEFQTQARQLINTRGVTAARNALRSGVEIGGRTRRFQFSNANFSRFADEVRFSTAAKASIGRVRGDQLLGRRSIRPSMMLQSQRYKYTVGAYVNIPHQQKRQWQYHTLWSNDALTKDEITIQGNNMFDVVVEFLNRTDPREQASYDSFEITRATIDESIPEGGSYLL